MSVLSSQIAGVTFPGTFISFEGVDGCGKSTQLSYVMAALTEVGLSPVQLREPGGTAISEKIRELLLDPDNKVMAADCELLLYEASRAQLVREVIAPALAAGELVVCDRFYDSTYAYQCAARGLDEAAVFSANALGSCGYAPTLTIVLDLDPKRAFARATQGGADRLESEGVQFQQKVRAGYHRLASLEPRRVHIVSAEGTPDEVFARIAGVLAEAVPELRTFDVASFLERQHDIEQTMELVTAAAEQAEADSLQETGVLEPLSS